MKILIYRWDVFDGAECCELVGAYILNLLREFIDKGNIGLYRDDGLGVFENLSGPQIERKKKKIINVFKDCGLKISVSANQKSVDFLDVTLNLDTDKYQPYTKPNSEIRYIHKNSNLPPNIINQLPKAIAIRLSNISSNEEVFMKTKGQYEKALYDSGFSTKLECIDYSDSRKNKDQRQRKRNIIWFNPPLLEKCKDKYWQDIFQTTT